MLKVLKSPQFIRNYSVPAQEKFVLITAHVTEEAIILVLKM